MKTGFLIPAVLALACLASGCATDAAQALRDVEPGYSLWSGTWQSTEFYLIQGTVAARIPDNVKVGQQIDIPVALSCSPYSEWRPGETYVDRRRGILKSEQPTAGSAASQGQPVNAKTIALTRLQGGQDLVEKYVIQFSSDMTSATGYWIGYDGDKGKFRLQKQGTSPAE